MAKCLTASSTMRPILTNAAAAYLVITTWMAYLTAQTGKLFRMEKLIVLATGFAVAHIMGTIIGCPYHRRSRTVTAFLGLVTLTQIGILSAALYLLYNTDNTSLPHKPAAIAAPLHTVPEDAERLLTGTPRHMMAWGTSGFISLTANDSINQKKSGRAATGFLTKTK